MSSEDIYKPNDFYRIRDRGILKDGLSMLIENVANDLNNYRRKSLQLEAENKRLEADVKKAFWWSAENTMAIHANKIQLAWEDFNTYFRGAKG